MNLGGDPLTFVSARLHFGMLESVVSRIQQLQGCTVPEIVEVVISPILPHLQIIAYLLSWY